MIAYLAITVLGVPSKNLKSSMGNLKSATNAKGLKSANLKGGYGGYGYDDYGYGYDDYAAYDSYCDPYYDSYCDDYDYCDPYYDSYCDVYYDDYGYDYYYKRK
jgi:hypothetical protein